MGETSYAKCGELSLAYRIFGAGPIELVFVGPFVGHVELFWTLPEFKSFFDQLGTFCRVVIFDKAGLGMSDPVPQVRTLDDRVDEIEAVLDAVGFERPAVFAMSEGGSASVLYAARRPERTRALILYGSFAFLEHFGWADLDEDPADLHAFCLHELGERYSPSIEQIEHAQLLGRTVLGSWGTGEAMRIAMPSMGKLPLLGTVERTCASPGMARASFESAFRTDVRAVLPTVSVPTLVIHARGDATIPVQCSRYLSDHIPGARWLEVEGVDHAPWYSEPDRILAEVAQLLTGSHAGSAPAHRALRTVLFTDIVASTETAARWGDERWRATLERFGTVTADIAARFGGTVIKSTGDGHLLTFEGPTRAIQCAAELCTGAETIGLAVRVGIHTGECELLESDIGGIAVHIAARILAHAGAGEILVSRTVQDLVVGSGTGFEDRGEVELRGVPGTWRLLAVDQAGPAAGSAEAELVSIPTPGVHSQLRPPERMVGAVVRRAPWMVRSILRSRPAANR